MVDAILGMAQGVLGVLREGMARCAYALMREIVVWRFNHSPLGKDVRKKMTERQDDKVVRIHKDIPQCPKCNHPMVDKKTLFKCNKCSAVIIKGDR